MKKIEITWGHGDTAMFLAPTKRNGLVVLDYDFDYEEIHRRCGGRCYHASRSGLSGNAYINSYGDLIPVGYYRVDTRYNTWHSHVEVAPGIEVMVPYESHRNNKQDLLKKYPVVVVAKDILVYCNYRDLKKVLLTLHSGNEFSQKPQLLVKTFINQEDLTQENYEVRFYNLWGERSYYPWEFLTHRLRNYQVYSSGEDLYSSLNLTVTKDGRVQKYQVIGENLYATDILATDPFEDLSTANPELLSGWQIANSFSLLRYSKKFVDILVWQMSTPSAEKVLERITRSMPTSKAEKLKEIIRRHFPSNKYLSTRTRVPKLLFLLEKHTQYASLNKRIAVQVYHYLQEAIEDALKDNDAEHLQKELSDIQECLEEKSDLLRERRSLRRW